MSFRIPEYPGSSMSGASPMRLSRKRTIERPEEYGDFKRLKRSTSTSSFNSGIDIDDDLSDISFGHFDPPVSLPNLSASTSTSTLTSASTSTPAINITSMSLRRPRISYSPSISSISLSSARSSPIPTYHHDGFALMRSASLRDFRSNSPMQNIPTPPETSAKYHLRMSKLSIDFTVANDTPNVRDVNMLDAGTIGGGVGVGIPTGSVNGTTHETGGNPTRSVWPVSWSMNNVLVFGRGNRVHFKNFMSQSEEVIQLCKVRSSFGVLRLIECAGGGGKGGYSFGGLGNGSSFSGSSGSGSAAGAGMGVGHTGNQANVVALSTSKGYIQLYDIVTKKSISTFITTGVTNMKWNGPILTVGGPRGAIRHYDTRIQPNATTLKLKEQTKKVTRHQAGISCLAWNVDGSLLASGDESGLVYCWDVRQTVPLDVGEMIQRRKKMQHSGAITALGWCPWSPKLLASGDSALDNTGTIRIWNINNSASSSSDSSRNLTGIIPLDAQITSLHWSPHCKELLSTHGPGKELLQPEDGSSGPSDPMIMNEYNSIQQEDDYLLRTPPANSTLSLASTSENQLSPSTPTGNNSISHSVVVHAYPSLRRITSLSSGEVPIAGSCLAPNGQRIVLAFPKEGKLKVWDVWAKAKEVKRHRSVLDISTQIR